MYIYIYIRYIYISCIWLLCRLELQLELELKFQLLMSLEYLSKDRAKIVDRLTTPLRIDFKPTLHVTCCTLHVACCTLPVACLPRRFVPLLGCGHRALVNHVGSQTIGTHTHSISRNSSEHNQF